MHAKPRAVTGLAPLATGPALICEGFQARAGVHTPACKAPEARRLPYMMEDAAVDSFLGLLPVPPLARSFPPQAEGSLEKKPFSSSRGGASQRLWVHPASGPAPSHLVTPVFKNNSWFLSVSA